MEQQMLSYFLCIKEQFLYTKEYTLTNNIGGGGGGAVSKETFVRVVR